MNSPAKIKFSSLKADLEREAEGDWVDYPDWPGARFLVRSLHTPSYTVKRDILSQKWARKYGRKPPPAKERSRELGRLYAEEILRGWDGFDEEYTPEDALDKLTNPEYRDVLFAVEYCASMLSQSHFEFVEDAAKNSEQPSATA